MVQGFNRVEDQYDREDVHYAWREKEKDPGDHISVVGYADGHYEIHKSKSGDRDWSVPMGVMDEYTSKERARKDAVEYIREHY
jgi:hypothetical protein